MVRKFTLFLLAGILLSGIVRAQLPCSTDEHYRKLLEQHPELAEYEKQFNEQLQDNLSRGWRTTATPDTVLYDVPIVIHVIHDYGVENVTDNDIYDAAAYWAVVFMKQNGDTISVIPPFVPYIGNPKIRLHLATKDPSGNPTKGVVRVQSYLANNAGDQAKYNYWPNNKYINIWLIGAFDAGSAGAAAYAYYPSTAAPMPYYDGVICKYNYIDIQKTVPHELGHVLNLKHVWGSTNNPGVACGDDNVDDTPPTMGHNPGCGPAALYDVTCAGGYSKTYTSSSGLPDSTINYPDTVNSQNIMDYTYCELMFSKGQVTRMRKALTSATAGRNNLITAANIAATGALAPRPDLHPTADYIMNRASGATTINDIRTYFMAFNNAASFWFRNASWNDTVSSLVWTFSNGATTPTSTSMTNVYNQFSQPGWVTVKLVANSNAGSDTLINTNAVYAADTTPAGGLYYTQAFPDAASINTWPMFNYYNNQFKWQLYSSAGYTDNSCIRYRSFDTSARRFGTATGDYDDFFTPAFNLTTAPDSLNLNFFTTGASTTTGIGGSTPKIYDSLEIDASINGGTFWTKIAGFSGADLANNGNKTTEFVPTTTTAWKARTVKVPVASRAHNTFFRFRYRPGNAGNNLYLDNFTLSPYPAGVDEIVKETGSFNIFPNPSSIGFNIVFKTGNSGIIYYAIKDLAGKTVHEQTKTLMPNSVQQEVISRNNTPAAGMYFVTVVVDGIATTQKLVVY